MQPASEPYKSCPCCYNPNGYRNPCCPVCILLSATAEQEKIKLLTVLYHELSSYRRLKDFRSNRDPGRESDSPFFIPPNRR